MVQPGKRLGSTRHRLICEDIPPDHLNEPMFAAVSRPPAPRIMYKCAQRVPDLPSKDRSHGVRPEAGCAGDRRLVAGTLLFRIESELPNRSRDLLDHQRRVIQGVGQSMLYAELMTVREPDHHGGKDHGGREKRTPLFTVLLLVACIYPFRCVVRTSVHSELRALNIPFYLRPVYRL